MTLEDIVKDMVQAVKISVDAALSAQAKVFNEKIAEISKRIDAIDLPEKGEKGEKGDSLTAEDLRPMLKEMVDAIEIPKGEKGDSITAEDVTPLIKSLVHDAIEHIPTAENGKDAIEINIAPNIDVSKSYARGTYASHKGGLWKAVRKTHGMDGWEIIVDGVNEIKVISNNEREFTLITEKSSGECSRESFKIPSVVYKDVYREGTEYDEGDAVTFGGSLWIAKEKTSEKPSASSSWKLAVKRGRDAKVKI